MKIKILILTIITTISLRSYVNAGELFLNPSHGKFSPGCTVGIDLILDPKGNQISATDLVIESSMKFVDFQPTKLFPYFLPTKILSQGNFVHIVGFTINPSQRINQKGTIGKIFFKPENQSDIDGYVRFFFKKTGDTTDTNLSIAGGIDVLEHVRNGFYTFNGEECEYPDMKIKTKNTNFDKELGNIIKKIDKEHNAAIREKSKQQRIAKLNDFWQRYKHYNIGLLSVIIALYGYFRISKGKSKKK